MTTATSASTQDSLYGYSSFYLAHAFIDFILATPAILSNAILLITIYRDSHRQKLLWRTPVTLLVLNLSICDLLTGIIAGYGSFYYDITILTTGTSGNILGIKLTIIIVAILTNVVGSCTIVVMSFDRLIAIRSPLQYKTRVTKRKVKIFIVAVWIYALLFASLSRIGVPQDIFILLYCHLHVSIPIIIIAVVFWKTYHSLRLHNNRIDVLMSAGGELMSDAHRNRERKVLSAIQVVLGLFYITFMPQFVALNISFFHPWLTEMAGFKAFLYTANKVLLVNSSVNPFIYAWRIPKYRTALNIVFEKRNCLNRQNMNNSPRDISVHETNTADRPATLSTINS